MRGGKRNSDGSWLDEKVWQALADDKGVVQGFLVVDTVQELKEFMPYASKINRFPIGVVVAPKRKLEELEYYD
jgi:hypothetical protein